MTTLAALVLLTGLAIVLHKQWTQWRKVRQLDRPSKQGWEIADHGNHMHMLPAGTRVLHTEDPDGECPCHPVETCEKRGSGQDVWTYWHHVSRGRNA